MRNHLTDFRPRRFAALLLGLGTLGALGTLLVGSVRQTCGSSMGGAWDACDWVVLDKISVGHDPWAVTGTTAWVPGFRAIKRGDVVRIWLPRRRKSGRKAVMKRVVGLPGDTIEMVENVLVVNEHPGVEPYLNREQSARLGSEQGNRAFSWQSRHLVGEAPQEYVPSAATWGPLLVPAGHYFVMSDRRSTIADSRTVGFVSRRQIDARAVLQASWAKGIRPVTNGIRLVECDAGVPADFERCAPDWRAVQTKLVRPAGN